MLATNFINRHVQINQKKLGLRNIQAARLSTIKLQRANLLKKGAQGAINFIKPVANWPVAHHTPKPMLSVWPIGQWLNKTLIYLFIIIIIIRAQKIGPETFSS